MENSQQTWQCKAYFISTKFSELFAILLIFTLENIHLSGNLKWKKILLNPMWWNINENCDVLMLWSIASTINFKKMKTGEKTTLQVFFVLSTKPLSLSGIYMYGTLLLPLMLLFMFICVEFTEFTHAQSMILRSWDFILHVLRRLKMPYPGS